MKSIQGNKLEIIIRELKDLPNIRNLVITGQVHASVLEQDGKSLIAINFDIPYSGRESQAERRSNIYQAKERVKEYMAMHHPIYAQHIKYVQ